MIRANCKGLFVYAAKELEIGNNSSTFFFIKEKFNDEEKIPYTVIKIKKIFKASKFYKYISIGNILSVDNKTDKEGKYCTIIEVDKVTFDSSSIKADDYNEYINTDIFFSSIGL